MKFSRFFIFILDFLLDHVSTSFGYEGFIQVINVSDYVAIVSVATDSHGKETIRMIESIPKTVKDLHYPSATLVTVKIQILFSMNLLATVEIFPFKPLSRHNHLLYLYGTKQNPKFDFTTPDDPYPKYSRK